MTWCNSVFKITLLMFVTMIRSFKLLPKLRHVFSSLMHGGDGFYLAHTWKYFTLYLNYCLRDKPIQFLKSFRELWIIFTEAWQKAITKYFSTLSSYVFKNTAKTTQNKIWNRKKWKNCFWSFQLYFFFIVTFKFWLFVFLV